MYNMPAKINEHMIIHQPIGIAATHKGIAVIKSNNSRNDKNANASSRGNIKQKQVAAYTAVANLISFLLWRAHLLWTRPSMYKKESATQNSTITTKTGAKTANRGIGIPASDFKHHSTDENI